MLGPIAALGECKPHAVVDADMVLILVCSLDAQEPLHDVEAGWKVVAPRRSPSWHEPLLHFQHPAHSCVSYWSAVLTPRSPFMM